MWRNYLTVGVRALAKNRTYAVINIVGLAIGLAACLMLLVYVRYERSYDEWLPNVENVYQVQATLTDPGTQKVDKVQLTPFIAGETLRKDFPQIENKVYMMGAGPIVMRGNQAVAIEDGAFVDGNLFDILQVPFVSGDPRTALDSAGSTVLSRSQAQRLFGGADPIGQTLPMTARGRTYELRVTGVAYDGSTFR